MIDDPMKWLQENAQAIDEAVRICKGNYNNAAPVVPDEVQQLLAERGGKIKLDIGCGDNKQADFVGMDFRKTKNVQIQHSCEVIPYPLPDECCKIVLVSHLIEHLKPWLIPMIMDEWWRILEPGGQLWIAAPYATSFGFFQDPTHIHSWNEATPQYFDPSYFLYNIYKPKPWKIMPDAFKYYLEGNMEIVLQKLPLNHGIFTPGGYDSHPDAKKEEAKAEETVKAEAPAVEAKAESPVAEVKPEAPVAKTTEVEAVPPAPEETDDILKFKESLLNGEAEPKPEEVKGNEAPLVEAEEKKIEGHGVWQPQFNVTKAGNWQGWQKRVCIAVPTTGQIRIEWMMARMSQIVPVNWSAGDIMQFFNQYSPLGYAVAEARNICVKYSLEQGFEWTIFIDHDTLPPPDMQIIFNRYMRKRTVPIVSGLYFCKGFEPEPLIFRGPRGNSFFSDWKAGDKIWVDGIPMGCVLIHNSVLKVLWDESKEVVLPTIHGNVVTRNVFETPRQVYQDPESGQYHNQSGTEDLFFCDRIKANDVFTKAGWPEFQKMKYPFLMDTSVFCQHIDHQGNQYPANVGVRSLPQIDAYLKKIS